MRSQFAHSVARLRLLGRLVGDMKRAAPDRFSMPTLIVLGELQDPGLTAPAVEAMPRGRRVTLSDVGHIGGLIDAERVLSHGQPLLAAGRARRGGQSGLTSPTAGHQTPLLARRQKLAP